MAAHKSRRLRKKLYLGEFAIFGFVIDLTLACGNTEDLDLFIDEIVDYMASHNLCFGGGGDLKTFAGFVCSEDRYGSATQADIDKLVQWLSEKDKVLESNVGPLVDANYGL